MVALEPEKKIGLAPVWTTRLMTRSLQFLVDMGVLASAFVLAYLLRFDFNIPDHELHHALLQLPYVVLTQFLMLAAAGVYAFIWRYTGLAEVRAFINAMLSSVVPIALARIWMPVVFQDLKVPFSVIFIDTVLGFMGVLRLRVLKRIMHERHQMELTATATASERKKAVLLVGAGEAGMLAAKEILRQGGMGLDIKGFVDDDPNIKRAVLNGFHVLGTTQDLPRLVSELKIDNVVISIAHG